MKTVPAVPVLLLLLLLESCGACVRVGTRALSRGGGKAVVASEKVLLNESDDLLRYKFKPVTPPGSISSESVIKIFPRSVTTQPRTLGFLNFIIHDGPSFTKYVRERFQYNTSWAMAEADDVVYLRYTGEELAAARSIGSFYNDLRAAFQVSVCMHVDENGKSGISLEITGGNGTRQFTANISSAEGFSLVGETTGALNAGFLGEAEFKLVHNRDPGSYMLQDNEFKVEKEVCYPFSASNISFQKQNTTFSVSPGSLSFEF